MLVDNVLIPAAGSKLSDLIVKVTQLVNAADTVGWHTYDIDAIS